VRFRRVPVRIRGEVPECRYLVTFRIVPVKMLGEVPVGSGDDGW
jgi:hypothetical protein